VATRTYTNEPHGFGVTYDDARLTCVAEPGDPRLAAAWSSRIGNEIAAAVLFTVPGTTADEIAAGRALVVLITTDADASGPQRLGGWDWDAVTQREAPRFLATTGAACVDVAHVYWRGFPVLQLVARANPEVPAPRILEELGLLYTPKQTFSALVVWPTDDPDTWVPTAREVMDGFFLMPLEREGRVRTGHQHVRQLRITPTDERNRAAVG
jgi:hypothetical protein